MLRIRTRRTRNVKSCSLDPTDQTPTHQKEFLPKIRSEFALNNSLNNGYTLMVDTARLDGSFNLSIVIPRGWSPGTTHFGAESFWDGFSNMDVDFATRRRGTLNVLIFLSLCPALYLAVREKCCAEQSPVSFNPVKYSQEPSIIWPEYALGWIIQYSGSRGKAATQRLQVGTFELSSPRF